MHTYDLHEARGLKDFTTTDDGMVYFTDSQKDVIDMLNKGEISIVVELEILICLFDSSKEDISAVDIDFIQNKKILLVPTVIKNSVVAYKLDRKP